MQRIIKTLGALILLALAAWFGVDLSGSDSAQQPDQTTARDGSARAAPALVMNPGAERVAAAARNRESGMMVTVPAAVIKLLPDDNEGSRHQKFLVELANRQTLLVAHNIDLAKRVPLERGDIIEIHGQYEWNDRGGLLHWTHHDPNNWREGGWIVHQGNKYE